MTSVRLTNSTARDRFRALRFNSRRSGVPIQFYLNSRLPVYNIIPQQVTDLLHKYLLNGFDFPYLNEQVRPFGILSVDCDGNYSTYSPELLGMSLPKYGFFSFGNILENDFVDAVETTKFRSVFEDIQSGIKLCKESCAYYGYCGGGAPANKYYENGSF